MSIEIDDGVLDQVKSEFENLERNVKILAFFTQDNDCSYCSHTIALAQKIAKITEKISVETYNCDVTADKAKQYGIDKYPAMIIHGKAPYKIRFFGIPAGYEFRAFIGAIVDASRGTPVLNSETLKKLFEITTDVHIQVFVTPNCPHCVLAVRKAHQFAIMNSHITSDMIEAIEFQNLAQQYGVHAVPKIIINDKVEFEGALPETKFLEKILEALK